MPGSSVSKSADTDIMQLLTQSGRDVSGSKENTWDDLTVLFDEGQPQNTDNIVTQDNLRKYKEQHPGYRDQDKDFLLGNDATNMGKRIEDKCPPLYLLHSSRDDVVNIQTSREIWRVIWRHPEYRARCLFIELVDDPLHKRILCPRAPAHVGCWHKAPGHVLSGLYFGKLGEDFLRNELQGQKNPYLGKHTKLAVGRIDASPKEWGWEPESKKAKEKGFLATYFSKVKEGNKVE
ncbi:MAG: hypothetical protein Q9162_000990 [Coniocarpon cinnabarinum]